MVHVKWPYLADQPSQKVRHRRHHRHRRRHRLHRSNHRHYFWGACCYCCFVSPEVRRNLAARACGCSSYRHHRLRQLLHLLHHHVLDHTFSFQIREKKMSFVAVHLVLIFTDVPEMQL